MSLKSRPPRMRSWLFAPGDSERKMQKAISSYADIVLLDLEDSVAPNQKNRARYLVSEFLSKLEDRARTWVRINPLGSDDCDADLKAIMAFAPGGIFLPKAEGRADIEELDGKLTKLELENSIQQGSTLVAALVTETAKAMFNCGDYQNSPRLIAMSWGAEDLASVLGARLQQNPDGSYMPTFELARSLCLLGAVAANVVPVETVMPDFKDLETLKKRAEMVRSQGYRGMLAIHPGQIDIINQAFSPTAEEVSYAREVVRAFAENPGSGTVGLNGQMLDRPHLLLAQKVLDEMA